MSAVVEELMKDVLVARRRAEEHGCRGTLVEEHEVGDQRAGGGEPRRNEPVGRPRDGGDAGEADGICGPVLPARL